MPESEPLLPDQDSKSQRKRDMLALQKIGESLIKLTEEQLANVLMPDTLRAAIQHSKSLTSHEAKRRHLQYIGKLMREVDAEAIKHALQRIQAVRENNTAQFHYIEQWREKLISAGDDALTLFLKDHPENDRQQLRQLIRKAQQDRKSNKNTGAETALFKYLRITLKF